MKSYIQLLRVSHWSKNLFMFLPLFFSGHILDGFSVFTNLIIGFFCFSFIASSIYIINDLKDVELDKLHPEKKNRPFASGKVSTSIGIVIALILVSISIGVGYYLKPTFAIVLGSYFLLNILYTIKLKNISVLDISIIALGFVLRVVSGGIIPDIYISQWIIIMTFLLALFLGLAKRRDDVLIYNKSGQKMRKAVEGYNLEFINAAMVIVGAVTIVSYIMYTVSVEVTERLGKNLYLTSLFVILGVVRYLQISFVQEKSGNPTKILLKDVVIQLVLICFAISFIVLIYFNKQS